MLTTRFRATVSQKQTRHEGDQQQPCASERHAQRVDQAGTRKMAIPATGSRIISVKRANVSLVRQPMAPHCGRAAQADRTAVMRTHCTAWYLPCGRGQSDVALALYGRVLHGLSRGPPCPAPSPANRCGDVPIGSGSRREVELRSAPCRRDVRSEI